MLATDADTERYAIAGTVFLPFMALSGVSLGTLGAIALIPQDTFLNTALQASALCMAAGLLLAPSVAVLRQPLSIVRPENLLLIGIVYWLLLEPVQGQSSVQTLDRRIIVDTYLLIGLFALTLVLGAIFLRASPRRTLLALTSAQLRSRTVLLAVAICFVLGMTKYWLACRVQPGCYVDAFFVGRFASAWGGHGKLGGAHSFIHHTIYVGSLFPALAVTLHRLRQRRDAQVLLAYGLAAVFVLFLARDGGRRTVGMIVGAAGILWLLISPRSGRYKAGLAIAGVLALVVAMQLVLAFRSSGLAGALQAGALDQAFSGTTVRVDKNFRNLAWTRSLVPELHPYVGSQQLVYVLVRPIPRYFWPGKPVDGGFTLESTVGGTRGTYTESVIGDLYIMAGWWSVAVGGLVFGCLATLVAGVLRQSRTVGQHLIYAFGCLWLFVGLRSMHELVLGLYPILIWMALLFWLGRGRPQPAVRAGTA